MNPLRYIRALIRLRNIRQRRVNRLDLEKRWRDSEALGEFYDEAQAWQDPTTTPQEWGERFRNVRAEYLAKRDDK